MTIIEVTQEQEARPTLLETWGQNERMRHIPPLSWLVQKVDGDVRRRLDIVLASVANAETSENLEPALRGLCREIEKLGDAARHQRTSNHAPNELAGRLIWSVDHAVSAIKSIDESLFGRRYPFQTHERSKAECIYGALLAVLWNLERVTALVREIDPGVDERLYEGLVVLTEPLRAEPIVVESRASRPQ